MMKNCLLIAVLLISLSVSAQQKERNNAVFLGFGSYMISQNNFNPINEFCPTINVAYNRFFDDGFVVGAGYSFSNISHYKYNINNQEIQCKEKYHTLTVSLGYKIDIHAFSMNPYIAAGVGFSRYKSKDYDLSKDCKAIFTLNPGIRLGYEIVKWMIFTSYHCDLTPQYNHLYHIFNIGLGFLF